MFPDAPSGFSFGAVACGIRKSGALDLGLIRADRPAAAAGVFTRNRFLAAPVALTRRRVARGTLSAVVVNAGNANACTGRQGALDARRSGAAVARACGVPEREVGVCSTGVIGAPLPVDKLVAGVSPLVSVAGPGGVGEFARSIMTTDTVPKAQAAAGQVGGRPVRVVGVAKGAGMIQPRMATMLAFVVTDAAVDSTWLRGAVRRVADRTFNRVTVDGDTSTNDTLLVLCGGAAGHAPVDGSDPAVAMALEDLLEEVARPLALSLAEDGEGATKLVHVLVTGAWSERDAERAARAVANSPLVKTAVFGEDANWGRIVMAVGNSGARVAPGRARITFDDVVLVRDGRYAGPQAEAQATEVLRQAELTIGVDLGVGLASCEMHTCDLSLDYIRINADYRS